MSNEFCIYDEMGEVSVDHQAVFPKHPQMAKNIYEDDGGASIAEDFVTKQLMSQGMACALGWVDNGDFSLESLDSFVQGVSDLDGDGEVQPEEEDYYNEVLGAVADAMASLGADVDKIGKLINDGDADAGESIGMMLTDKLNTLDSSDDVIISNYALGVSDGEQIMESFIKRIHSGVVSLVRKKLHRVHKISSLVRAAIKKAGLKAHSAAANFHRQKSMKMRKSRGM